MQKSSPIFETLSRKARTSKFWAVLLTLAVIYEIIEHVAENDHVTVKIKETKHLVGKDLKKHIQDLENKMLNFASKLEFEDAARLRDEINRLKAKEIGIPQKALGLNK